MNHSSEKPLIPLPQNLTTHFDRDSFIIRRKWFSALTFFLLFFAIFWNGFMVVWMTLALRDGVWMMAAFGSIHALVGLFMAYFCVASCINKTDVVVDPNYLTVRHYPMPWFGSKKIRVHSIQQLYSKEHISRSKNGVNISYRVYVLTNDNREQKLLTGLTELSQAHFIEHEIENVLGIKDQAVAGEYRKS
ncbi:hypothetical protein SH580_05490 [Coraliomargarita algicola]|uniref:DUF304 domain-containing protein n=1 Tax=Coraliomargarita algicola TaxID=3092156 RepID=A0ABZ0RQU7_9BACT|nr:hypothetical protein [Coraliomargarita sp. J2-16]WPJ97160.1 hypothetical protein SH580_05490 [Coraliomargarita sp. J2-16]